MTERYLEDFAVGQVFGSGRLVVDEERIKSFAAEFDPQPFHLDEMPRRARSFAGWRQAAGTRQRRPCGCWSRATSSPPAGSSAPASTSSAGRARSVPETSCAWRASAGRAAVEVASRTGMDQGPDDDAEPERRRRADPDRQPGAAAPAGLGVDAGCPGYDQRGVAAMTQTQAAGVRADQRPSAIVVGVGAEQGLGARYADALPRRDITSSPPGGRAARSTRSRRRSPAQVAAPRRS